MIKQLKLTNFKRHRALTLNFTAGLNVIRGANENGKSTLFHGVAYALWGTRALPESLDETVTWGEPASSLLVELVFTFEGVDYSIVRGKSGAELTGPNVTASGQAEVTRFVERLLGVGHLTGFATLVQNQSALQMGTNSTAISLIETLADMSLIDDYVSKVQEELPCGNTKIVEARVASFNDLVEPTSDFSLHEEALWGCQAAEEAAKRAVESLQRAAQEAAQPAVAAQERIVRRTALADQRRAAERRVATLEAAMQAETLPDPTEALQQAEARASRQLEQREAQRAYRMFIAHTGWAGPTFDGSCADFIEQYEETNTRHKESIDRLRELELMLVTEVAKRIEGQTCNWCGMDLQDVLSVQQVNARIDTKVQESELERKNIEVQMSIDNLQLSLMQKSDAEQAKRVESVTQYPDFMIRADRQVPNPLQWVGPDLETLDETNYAELVALLRKRLQAYIKQAAERGAVTQQLKEARATLAGLQPDDGDGSDESAVEAHQDLLRRLRTAELSTKDRTADVVAAQAALHAAQQAHAAAVATYERAVGQRTEAQELLGRMVFHNTLIKKLREARPVVARELWALVLSGVSHIFSQIRGVNSTVTRTNDDFLIDGKKVSSYSGSTKDSLGLAIRVMLQKTFMGSLDFLLLDEPAAACDAERELDMLATIARADFGQVILVTHSDRADALAANIISL